MKKVGRLAAIPLAVLVATVGLARLGWSAGVESILTIEVADGRTVLCVVETRANPKDKEAVEEAILV